MYSIFLIVFFGLSFCDLSNLLWPLTRARRLRCFGIGLHRSASAVHMNILIGDTWSFAAAAEPKMKLSHDKTLKFIALSCISFGIYLFRSVFLLLLVIINLVRYDEFVIEYCLTSKNVSMIRYTWFWFWCWYRIFSSESCSFAS